MFKAILILAVLFLCSSSCFAQNAWPQAAAAQQPGWISTAWMSPQSPVDVFTIIDKLNRPLKLGDLAKYSAAASSNPLDETAAAQYGYSLFLGVSEGLNAQAQLDNFVLHPLSSSSHVTKAYARSYFLCCSIDDGTAPEWAHKIGLRLLQEDPNDYYVLYGMCRTSEPWRGPEQKAAGLALAKRMIRLRPNSALSYSAEYVIYNMCALTNGELSSLDNAIVVGRKILSLAKYPASTKLLPRQLHLLKLLRLEYIQQQQAGTMPKIWYPPATPPVPAKTAPITVIYGTDSEELTPTPNCATPTPAPGSGGA